MNSATDQNKSWYWVFLVPFVFIAFFWTLDELNIDEEVFVPALAMTGIALTVILTSRVRHGKKHGTGERISWWPWLLVGPALFIMLVCAVDELNIKEEIYLPAFVFTFIGSIIAFTKRRHTGAEVVAPASPDQLAAAKVAPVAVQPAKKSVSWIWALLIPMAALTIVAVVLIVTRADLERQRMNAYHPQLLQAASSPEGRAWHDMLLEAERENREARREAERALRAAEREVGNIERRNERLRQEVTSEREMEQLLVEEEQTKQHLEKAKQLVVQAKAEARRSLDDAREYLEDAVENGELDISIDGVSIDDAGLNVRVIRENRPLIVRLNPDGAAVEMADESVEISAEPESEDCDTEDCQDQEAESSTEIVAECDEDDWQQENDWSEVASELHGALFAEDGPSRSVVVAFEADKSDQPKWKEEWQESMSRDRPAWILDANDYSGRKPQIVVTTGPYRTQSECKAMRDDQIAESVTEYASAYLHEEGAEIVPWYGAAKLHLPKQRLREYIKDEYYGIHKSSTEGVGDRPVIYTLLEFDQDFGEKLVTTHRQQSVTLARMAHAGIGSFGLLGVLAAAFGYLKFDEQSSGTKRGRLKLGALALIALITLVAGAALFMVPFI